MSRHLCRKCEVSDCVLKDMEQPESGTIKVIKCSDYNGPSAWRELAGLIERIWGKREKTA